MSSAIWLSSLAYNYIHKRTQYMHVLDAGAYMSFRFFAFVFPLRSMEQFARMRNSMVRMFVSPYPSSCVKS